MTQLDWIVIAVYLLLMLVGASWLGRRQKSRKDYYLADNKLPSWTLATSILATQCSTNSLLGAPAFVGFVIGGGMIWLQYELAVPLAMLALCFLFLPIKRSGAISIYAFLENRLGRESRLLASGCFLVFRGVATGVTLYGVASIVELITGLPFLYSALILMGVTIAYDVLGGMKAVVISDVVQMALLLGAVLIALVWLMDPLTTHYAELGERTDALVNDWGFSGNNYGFWPMLFGGLFLYTAYYGCDQSQAQRLLSAADDKSTQRVLMLNGLFRFPLVLAYCTLGLGLAAYALQQTDFVASLPKTLSGDPNFNLVFPSYVLREFAPGMAGLVIVGLFAAAMSSIDSALNSLSASTLEDFGGKLKVQSERQFFLYSKFLTFVWGIFALVFSFQVERIAPTVLEAINKVGSLANGPLLALFCIAIFSPAMGQRAAISGFVVGLLGTGLVSLVAPSISWLWWNPIGFCLCWFAAMLVTGLTGRRIRFEIPDVGVPKPISLILLGMAVLILVVIALL